MGESLVFPVSVDAPDQHLPPLVHHFHCQTILVTPNMENHKSFCRTRPPHIRDFEDGSRIHWSTIETEAVEANRRTFI